jgi:hypothetical protein
MPKICEPCGFYSADNAPTACPTCGGAVKLTFLPPPGAAAAPLPEAAPEDTAIRKRNLHPREGFLASLGISRRVLLAIGSVLFGITSFAVRQAIRQERVDKIRPGMHISEAAKLIDSDTSRHRHPTMVRFRDRFAPDDTSSGTYTYDDASGRTVLRWENGIVTSVERRGGGSGGGMRRRTTTVEDDGNDEDVGDG